MRHLAILVAAFAAGCSTKADAPVQPVPMGDAATTEVSAPGDAADAASAVEGGVDASPPADVFAVDAPACTTDDSGPPTVCDKYFEAMLSKRLSCSGLAFSEKRMRDLHAWFVDECKTAMNATGSGVTAAFVDGCAESLAGVPCDYSEPYDDYPSLGLPSTWGFRNDTSHVYLYPQDVAGRIFTLRNASLVGPLFVPGYEPTPKCVTPPGQLPVASTCSKHHQCASGYCRDERCTVRDAVGSACTLGSCVRGATCRGSCVAIQYVAGAPCTGVSSVAPHAFGTCGPGLQCDAMSGTCQPPSVAGGRCPCGLPFYCDKASNLCKPRLGLDQVCEDDGTCEIGTECPIVVSGPTKCTTVGVVGEGPFGSYAGDFCSCGDGKCTVGGVGRYDCRDDSATGACPSVGGTP